MAKIYSEQVVITFSRIIREDEHPVEMINDEIVTQIDIAMNELYGSEGAVVEVRQKAVMDKGPKDA